MNNELWFNKPPGGGGYAIERSLRFNSADSAYLSRTPGSAGNRKTWTWAGWVKRGAISSGSYMDLFTALTGANDFTEIRYHFNANDDALMLSHVVGGVGYYVYSSNVFRDPSSWYHVVVAVDTTQSTSTNRVKIYVNGVQVTQNTSGGYPAQNSDTSVNATAEHRHGSINTYGRYLDGYLADIHFIDGQALDPTSFGEFDDNGIWQPIAYTGSYGTNGFHLPFSDNSTAAALGTDTSGNGNTWTVNNISVTAGAGNDSLVDVPTNGSEVDTGLGNQVRGNYCTLNPLDGNPSLGWTNGNLDVPAPSDSWRTGASTFGVTSGKWYWEVLHTGTPGGNQGVVGIVKQGYGSGQLGGDNSGYGYYTTGEKTGTGTNFAYGASWTTNDIIGVAFDADNGTLTFYKNNVSQGVAWTGITGGPWMPAVSVYAISLSFNFGQRPFAYTAPSGFKALCTANLPAPLVTKPSDLFDVKLYTGNGGTQTITGLGFNPDLLWFKSRSVGGNGYNNIVFDAVRGSSKSLATDLTVSEYTGTDLTSFNSDGFTVAAPNQWFGVNDSGTSFAAWAWDAGSSTVTNTDGSISSQVRANASAGFSIVTYTTPGSLPGTIGHGLGAEPYMIITKSRGASGGWGVYHKSIGNTNLLLLNGTNASTSGPNQWNSTTPTSTVFSIGTDYATSATYVAYCFAPVAGYSAFGSYTGNGSTDGNFVYTGFRPRWLMIKDTTGSTNYWWIYDTARDTYNASGLYLFANVSDAEQDYRSTYPIDILSNGFKVRNTLVSTNNSVFVYAAFAEHPFQYARAR